MKQRQRTFFFDFLVQQLTLTVLPLLLLGAAFFMTVLPSINQLLFDGQKKLADSINSTVTAFFVGAEELLALRSLDLLGESEIQQSLKLQRFVQSTNVFETAYAVDDAQIIRAIGLPESMIANRAVFVGTDISRSPALRFDSANSTKRWSPVYQSLVTNAASSALSLPFGEGVLVAEFNMERLSALVADLSVAGTLVMIIDSNGNLIAHPDSELSKQQISMRFSDLFTDSTDQMRTGRFTWQQETYQAVVAPVPDMGWQTVVAQTEAVFFASTRQVFSAVVVVLVLSLLMMIAFVVQSARKLSRPIESLQKMSSFIEQGRFDIEAVYSPIKELQQLSDQFLNMALRLADRELENQALNEQLEQRVAMRTSQLAKANAKLTESMHQIEATMEQLVQSEKLASLGSMVAGIAHELNTPIGNGKVAISTQLDYIRDIQVKIDQQQLTKAALDEFIADMFATADISMRNLERAKDLISSFKQVSVDQTSSITRDFDLATIVKEVLVTLRPAYKNKPFNVETQLPENIQMHSKPGALMQILTNLINNALLHAMSDTGETLTVVISAQTQGDQVKVVVQDDGVGMPPEHVKRAFDPFFTTKMGKGGSGLGLNIVNRMVVGILQGEISLTSQVGQGTTFELRLPLSIREQQRSEMEASAEIRQQG